MHIFYNSVFLFLHFPIYLFIASFSASLALSHLTVTLNKSRRLQLASQTKGTLAAALSGTLSTFVQLLCLKLLLEKLFVQLLSLFLAVCLFEHKYTESNVKLESDSLYVYTYQYTGQ